MSFLVKVITSQSSKTDSFNLYDYNLNENIESKFEIKKNCNFYMEAGCLRMDFSKKIQKNQVPNETRDFLLSIHKEKEIETDKNNFKLKFYNENHEKQNSYLKDKHSTLLVLRHTSLKYGFKLKKKDIIQMGKVRFKVKETSMEELNLSEIDLNTGKINALNKKSTQSNLDDIKIHSSNEGDNFEYVKSISNNHNDLGNNFNKIEVDLNNSKENIVKLNNTFSNIFKLNTLTYMSPMQQSIQTEKAKQNIFSNYSYLDKLNLNGTNLNISISSSNNNLSNLYGMKLASNRDKKNILLIKNENKLTIPSKIAENSLINLCRICLNDGKEEILISACKCIGSVKYIHFNCLQKWLISKINIKYNFHLITYSFEKFTCELCKAEIPNKIKIKEKVYKLIETKKILEKIKSETSICSLFGDNLERTKYVTLELLQENNNNQSIEKRYMHIISFGDKQNLKIGRSTESEIKLSDYSISRNHAMIYLKDDGFYLRDLNSKFGTHLDLSQTNHINLLLNQTISIQVNHILFRCNLVRYSSCLDLFKCIKREKISVFKNHREIDYNSNNILIRNNSTEFQKLSDKVKIAEVEENIKHIPLQVSFSTPIKLNNGENLEKNFNYLKFKPQRSQEGLLQIKKPLKFSYFNQPYEKNLIRNETKCKLRKSKSYSKNIVNKNIADEEKHWSKRPITIRIKNINNFIEKESKFPTDV